MIEPDVVEAVWRHQGGCCAICGNLLGSDFQRHHARIHDTKWVRLKYPLFIDSAFNIKLVHGDCHMMHPSHGRWPEAKVQWFEYRMLKAAMKVVRYV